jgi:hypothetical protein
MSVFALRVRELWSAPQPKADAGALSRDDWRRVLVAVGVALLFSLALVFSLLALPVAQQNAPVAAPHPVQPAWVEIQKPFRLFAWTGSDWGRELMTYTAERHRDGGGRRDHLSFGTFGSDQPWLHLTLYRMGTEEADLAPFFVDMARRAAPAGLSVAAMAQPKPLPTRFGTFEVAEFTLDGQAAVPGQSTRCLGFRLAGAKALLIGGFACGAPGRAIERARLACALDRIDLVAAGDDTELRGFFTGAAGELGAACRTPPAPATAEAGEPAKAASGFTIVR